MMSVLFNKSTVAMIVTGIVWFVLCVPYWLFNVMSYKLISCISLNTAMAHGIRSILNIEELEYGMQWSDLWQTAANSGDISVGITMCFLLGSSLLHLLIALYVEKIAPGEFGVPEKWYFLFTKQFWCGAQADNVNENGNFVTKYDNFEADPQNLQAGIKVRNLRKVYGNKKEAVKGLTLNMFNDQITVLLGHNGAGKTTAMSMLIGMFPPTSGTAFINGHDIRANIREVRGSIGFCPQHNILFDAFTVREHIEFYCELKGVPKNEVQNEVSKYVKQLELQPFIDSMPQSLSGGMKRKLSVAIALCGNSKVVFCDEPTSGMDPSARRTLWDLLQKEKANRTILLTTHFMDEADVLGDRIAIMAEGELQCYGSPFFLKKRLGSGYRLVCVKQDGCDPGAMTNIVRRFIPGIEIHTNIASELTYVLPVEHIDQFESLFGYLEDNQSYLKLSSFGVSLTPLEEVFFKVATDSMITTGSDENGNSNGSDLGLSADEASPLLSGYSLHLNQWHAMFKKRLYCWMRSWVVILLQFLIPLGASILIIIASTYLSNLKGNTIEKDALSEMVSLDNYGKTVTMLETPKSYPSLQIEK